MKTKYEVYGGPLDGTIVTLSATLDSGTVIAMRIVTEHYTGVAGAAVETEGAGVVSVKLMDDGKLHHLSHTKGK